MGYSYYNIGGNPTRGFLWENSVMTDLGTLGDPEDGFSWALAINDRIAELRAHITMFAGAIADATGHDLKDLGEIIEAGELAERFAPSTEEEQAEELTRLKPLATPNA